MNYCIVDNRTPSVRGEVLGADTTWPVVASRYSRDLGTSPTLEQSCHSVPVLEIGSGPSNQAVCSDAGSGLLLSSGMYGTCGVVVSRIPASAIVSFVALPIYHM